VLYIQNLSIFLWILNFLMNETTFRTTKSTDGTCSHWAFLKDSSYLGAIWNQVEMQPDLYQRETQAMLALPGLKSPSRISTKDNFKSVRPARHDFSRARARAIEASLEHDEPWVPPAEPHVKTPEEEVGSAHNFVPIKLWGTYFL
jgi:hypothetical protein